MTARTAYVLLALAVTLASAGCGITEASAQAELTVSVDAEKATAAPGESVAFDVYATGTFLVRVTVEYGDTQEHTRDMNQVKTYRTRVSHAYTEAGRFLVTATAWEISGRSVSDTLSVTVVAAR